VTSLLAAHLGKEASEVFDDTLNTVARCDQVEAHLLSNVEAIAFHVSQQILKQRPQSAASKS
jgi:hypothetical protein